MSDQLARGLYANFAPSENPFGTPNGMEDNLRTIDDHLALYTLQEPVVPGTPLPEAPAAGDGQIYTDGSYAVFNAGAWRAYPARLGVRAMLLGGTENWTNNGAGWEQFSVLDTGPAVAAAQAAIEPLVASAELARDVAQAIAGGMYATEAAGRAAVADNATFSVQGSGDVAAYIYRRIDAGNSTLLTTLASKQAVDNLTAVFRNSPAPSQPVISSGSPILAIGAPGADGFLYALLSILEDGSFVSPPLAAFVQARLAGLTFQTAVADQWGSFAIVQADADGLLYVLAGIRSDGTFFAPGMAPSTDGVLKILHIPFLGQSNAAADESKPALSITPTGWGSYRFAIGVHTWSSTSNPTSPESRPANNFALEPLIAGSVETRANGMADSYKAKLVAASRFSGGDHTGGPHILVSFSGLGGRKLTELGPVDDGASGDPGVRAPGGHWPTMLDDIARGKAAAAAAGMEYDVPFWVYDQGESESELKLYFTGPVLTPTQTRDGYTALAIDMAEEFDAQVRSITDKTVPTPLIVTPPCSTTLISQAWMDANDQSDLVFIAGPRYMMPSALLSSYLSGGVQTWGNWIHHSPDGHRWIGEMCAKVGHRLVNEARNWEPLRALSARKSGATTVDVTFNVPEPPLVIDTSLIAKMQGWGFSVFTGGLDAPAGRVYATGVEILADGRTVRATFAAPIAAGAQLTLGIASLVDLGIAPVAVAVGVGPVSSGGFSQYTVSVAGDITDDIAALLNDDVFYLYGPTSRGTIRDVQFTGGNTVFTGEDRELLTGGTYTPFSAGNALSFGRVFGGLNVRDSDSAMSVNTFATGRRAGQPYPLHNWACQGDGIPIEGA
jgi:hypothetical protein